MIVNAKWFELWLSGRPPQIREIARKYPPGTRFNIHGDVMWVVGYGEEMSGGSALLVSLINPAENYAAAVDTKVQVCSCCVPKLDELKIKDGE